MANVNRHITSTDRLGDHHISTSSLSFVVLSWYRNPSLSIQILKTLMRELVHGLFVHARARLRLHVRLSSPLRPILCPVATGDAPGDDSPFHAVQV